MVIIRHFVAVTLLTGALFFGAGAQAQDVQGEDVETASEQEAAAAPLDAYPPDEYMKGVVVSVEDQGEREIGGFTQPYQVSRVRVLDGAEKGKELELTHAGIYNQVEAGDKVVIAKITVEGESEYFIADEYRLTPMLVILLAFFALATALGRRHGAMSIVGLGFSILVLAKYVVPQIVAGKDPLVITLTGAFVIMLVSVTLAHGFNRRTAVSLASMTVTLCLAAAIAALFVDLAGLLGLGSEDAAYLQLGPLSKLSLKGLLLGGIIIGTLGVLDDVTTAQVASVDEIRDANPSLGFAELYRRGLSVGREHIASLINTLALAYAGASLPMFILFSVNRVQPLWVIVNSETVAEEIIRTLVGSTALIVAVPLSTALAAWTFSRARGTRQKPSAT